MTFSVLNPVYFSGTYRPKLFVVWDSVGQLHHFSVLSFKCSSLWLLWQYYFLPTSVAKPSLCLFWFLLLFFWKMCAFPKAVSAIHFFSASPLIASGPTEQRFYLFPFIVLQNFLQPQSCSTPTPPLSAGDCDPPVRRKQGVKPFGFLSTFCWPPHALPLTSSPLVCEEEKASSCPKPILNHASTHAVLFRNRTYLYWLFPLCLTFSTASSLWFGAHARVHVCVLSHFSHIQLCNPMDYSLPGSSVCRTF